MIPHNEQTMVIKHELFKNDQIIMFSYQHDTTITNIDNFEKFEIIIQNY